MNKKLLFFIFFSFSTFLNAQTTSVSGKITDVLTNEPVSFATVIFKGTSIGTLADIDGNYKISTDNPSDSLQVLFVGYVKVALPVKKGKTQVINFVLSVNKFDLPEVEIKPGENPAHELLRKIIANKEKHNQDNLEAFKYEAYNKLEFDVTNISEDFKKNKLIKPFAFIFDNIDSSSTNEKPYLPMFISESLSDVYYKKNGNQKKEIIKASKASGFENQTISQFLGDMHQTTNVYDNFIGIFGKSFVSPIASSALIYYKYYLLDSLFIGNKWCYKMSFKPRRSQELTFSGEMWVHDSSFAIKKITMHISPDANINFLNDIAVVKEYDKVNNEHWMLTKDILVVDFVTKGDGMGFIGRKTTSYKKFELNKVLPDGFFNIGQSVVINDNASAQPKEFWKENRHDTLALREKKIYAMVDTIKKMPVYRTYIDLVTTIVSGYKKINWIELGPYFNLYSYNLVEGHRFRLGFRTNNKFSDFIGVDGYLAYGTMDERYKYFMGLDYLITKSPRQKLRLSHQNDVEQLGNSQNAIQEGNILVSAFRRIPLSRLTNVEESRLSFEREWFHGFSTQITLNRSAFRPLGTLDYSYYPDADKKTVRNLINTSEVQFYWRFAFQEKIISGKLRRVSLGTKYPILSLNYIIGLKGIAESDFNYNKIIFAVNQKVKLPPLGHIRYTLEAGKIFGTLPFPLLSVHHGNEAYTLDKKAFNLMNYYEFVSDKYLSLLLEHHLEGILFDRIPLIKKLKLREVLTARSVIGTLSAANRSILVDPNAFYSLETPYLEMGAGIENILRLIRVDAIWRFTHLSHTNIANFGIRAGLQITF